ncbi:MAG: methyltransferase domain-containing protein [Chloroflexota bacterium]
MNKHKYDAVAHSKLFYGSPINDEMVLEIADLMQLTPGMSVVDLGCAKAEVLIRMADSCQVRAYGADVNDIYLRQAQEAIANRAPAADITLIQQDVSEYGYEEDSFDAVLCIQTSELYGTYDKAMMEVSKFAKPGGMVLIGDYYWRNQPQTELEPAFDVTNTYVSSIEVGMQEGLTPLFASVCTKVDIDRYIWSQIYAVEMYALENPDDEDVPAMLNRARMTRNLYTEFGHETLGFGLFLFRKPD